MDHLNWGVLGASKFALEHLTPAMQLSKNNRFLALATRSKQKAAPFVRLEPGIDVFDDYDQLLACLLYTSPSPRDKRQSRMPSSA